MGSGNLIRISGLWQKDTRSGPVLSAQLKPDARKALLEALAGDDDAEIVVFVNGKRDRDSSPTHNLCLSIGNGRREAPASPQGQRERPEAADADPWAEHRATRQPASGGGIMEPTWPERKPVAPEPDEDLPF